MHTAEGCESALDHAHLHMTDAAGVQFHRGHARLLDLERVHIGLEVGLDNAEVLHAQGAQLLDQSQKQRGLARTRRRHDVYEKGALPPTIGAEGVGGRIVRGQDVLLDFDDFALLHGVLLLGSLAGVILSHGAASRPHILRHGSRAKQKAEGRRNGKLTAASKEGAKAEGWPLKQKGSRQSSCPSECTVGLISKAF